jgi:salicylate hydroxylase
MQEESGMTANLENGNYDVDVAIIGAGIGGLAAAVALRQVGLTVHVFEQARQLGEVGGGVVIREPSVSLLRKWGLGELFEKQAVRFSRMSQYASDGRLVGEQPVKVEPAEPDWAYSIHRADLHHLLLSKADPTTIHLSHAATTVEDNGSHGAVHFANGARLRASTLIGADGIRSKIRGFFSRDELVFTGFVNCRSLTPASELPAELLPNDHLRMWFSGDGRFMNMLPVSAGSEVSLGAIVTRATPPPDLWSSTISAEEVLGQFADFPLPLAHLIRKSRVPITMNAVYEREPIARWSSDRITLLGDAAHAMAPRLGQGANQAIQDAAELAAQLAGTGASDIPAALRRYQDIRAPYTAKIQLASRQMPAGLGVQPSRAQQK